jgi:hypothetical protein
LPSSVPFILLFLPGGACALPGLQNRRPGQHSATGQ